MSETLYNTSYYPSLLGIIQSWSNPDSLTIIGTKTLYFGLGGGTYEFMQFVNADKRYQVEIREKLNDMKSIERQILFMRATTLISETNKDEKA